jgi:hypothetical protein
MIPRDVCNAMNLYSCHPCDLYREVMDAKGRYKGKSQQEYRRRYRCICPNKSVILRMPEHCEMATTPSPDGSEGEEEELSPCDSQTSSLSSMSMHHSLRKRKACYVYELPDSESSD